MEYQRPAGGNGITASLIIIFTLLLLALGACGVITDGAARMTDSVTTNGASVLNTWTQESGKTTRTRIEWETRLDMKALDVDIASIQADATKKTSFAFVLFYLVRVLIGVAIGLFAAAVVDWAAEKWREAT